MDIMGVVSSAIQGITKSYGKRVGKKTTAPVIDDVMPQTIKGDTYRLGFATDEIMPQDFPNSVYWIAGHGSGHSSSSGRERNVTSSTIPRVKWFFGSGSSRFL